MRRSRDRRRRPVRALVALTATALLALPTAAAAATGPTAPAPGGTAASPTPATPDPAPSAGPGATPDPATQAPADAPLVLLGTGGLTWEDVGADHPALWAMLEGGSAGVLAVRSVRSTACPADGWLAVSAGRRAADVPAAPGAPACREIPAPQGETGGTASVPRWQEYVDEADAASFDAHPGLLGRTLQEKGIRSAAVGPGAAVALAVPAADGRTATVQHAFPGPADGAGGRVDPTLLADDVRAAVATGARVIVVDLGAIRDPGQRAEGTPELTGAYASPRAEQVQRLDERLGLVFGTLPAGSTVVLASLADAGDKARLRLVAAAGPAPVPAGGLSAFATSLLTSPSTRQDGIAQTTDLLPTVLAAVGVDRPSEAVGAPLRPVPADGDVADRLQRLTDIDQASTSVTPIVPWFFQGWIVAQLVLYGLATLALRRGGGAADHPAAAQDRRRTLAVLRRGAIVFATVPVATFLANLLPWWRADVPWPAVTGAVIAFVVPISLLALLGPWRGRLLGPFGVVGAITALVLALDVLTGSRLALSSLMGVQPVVAGRWYGFNNTSFALFATGALLAAIAVADQLLRAGRRRAAVAAVAAIGVVATVLDGTPGLGSDFGGPPALVPAFAVLALLVAGVRLTWRRALLIAAATVLILVALSVVDWLRPAESRTHLGRFVQTVLDGGMWPVIQRKAAQNFEILFKPISLPLPFAIAFVVLVLSRPVAWGARPLQLAYDRSPVLRHGLIALAVLLALGFALNDSGTAIPAVAGTVALPLLIAVSARALELDDEARVATTVRTRKPPRR